MPPKANTEKIEYTHKKSSYVFPAGTKLFLRDNKLTAEIAKKKITDISIIFTFIKMLYDSA